jgi:hypothetical protein
VVKWNVWRSVVAGALIGFVEAAGLAAIRPTARAPLRVVRPARRRPSDPLARCGVWFLDPLPVPRPPAPDRKRPALAGGISLMVPRRWSMNPPWRDPRSRPPEGGWR